MPEELSPHPSSFHASLGAAPATSRFLNVSRWEVVGFAAWCWAIFALTLAATLAIVHRAVESDASTKLTGHFLVVWLATWGGAALLLSVLAGLLVFRRTAPWQVVLTWPWLIGPVVGVAYFLGLTGQMDGTSKLCDAPANGSCDTAWGLGAALLSAASGVVLGGLFVLFAALKRLALHLRSNTRKSAAPVRDP